MAKSRSAKQDCQLVKNPVAVEKLLLSKSTKIKSRQEAPESIFSGRLDIFYPPNFACLGWKGSFSTATPDYNNYLRQDTFLASMIPDYGEMQLPQRCQISAQFTYVVVVLDDFQRVLFLRIFVC